MSPLPNRNTQSWAREEFGGTQLGDARRTARLVAIGAAVAHAPAGRVTEVMATSCEREGAYRFLESAPSSTSILRSTAQSCARRAVGHSIVLCVGDETGLSLAGDRCQPVPGLGPVGVRGASGMGLLCFSVTGYTLAGVPLGLLDQRYFSRPLLADGRTQQQKKHRPANEKEIWHVVQSIAHTTRQWRASGGKSRLWYVLDRGGDSQDVLKALEQTGDLFTVRASQNRCATAAGTTAHYLWDVLDAQKPAGRYVFDAPKTHGRKARRARMEVRYCAVTLMLRAPGKNATPHVMTAVLAREKGTTPEGEEPIEWLLLTNWTVNSLAAARFVIGVYTKRWRCEDFHKVWKCTCRVEDSQLEAASRIEVWATILAAVSMRILRLTHLARNTPDEPASVELSELEQEALIRLRRPKGVRIGDAFTIKTATVWIAEIGGYTGWTPSRGPPGPKTIGRGLVRLEAAASALKPGLD